MKKVLALVCCFGVLALGANVYANWCSTDTYTITCENPAASGYTEWRVGKYVITGSDRVYACAKSGVNWYLVGWVNYNSESTLEVIGNAYNENIFIVDTTVSCDTGFSY